MYTDYKIFIVIIFLLISNCVAEKTEQAKTETVKGPTAGRESLREGDCGKAVLGEMVYQDHVRKPAVPFLSRNATLPWHGDAKIYCIIIEPDKDQLPGAQISIKDGGINHTFVNMEIISKTGEGLNYIVQVFGKNVK